MVLASDIGLIMTGDELGNGSGILIPGPSGGLGTLGCFLKLLRSLSGRYSAMSSRGMGMPDLEGGALSSREGVDGALTGRGGENAGGGGCWTGERPSKKSGSGECRPSSGTLVRGEVGRMFCWPRSRLMLLVLRALAFSSTLLRRREPPRASTGTVGMFSEGWRSFICGGGGGGLGSMMRFTVGCMEFLFLQESDIDVGNVNK